ncbi:single-stranded DNA-binding protein [Novibacillus thermophilus]|uniref:Single-stranded DNA-binding protein n=1 Tax=Novibacillus thermophilus TaxID=1471761 RepID=A0A1U9K6Q2_9BACL|nr:single-stranded DNA-binding protein [Novibacillus thermophilus]AQS55686.1 single-stranded DNA-binding protein [Novibacillus thermophilus]
MINRIVIVGRLTKDPELRYTPNGVATTTFTLAVERPFTNRDGNREADFIRIVTWRNLAEACANYLKKGRLAGVDGRLQIRSFDGNDGNRVTLSEVVADNVRFLEPKDGNKKSNTSDEYNDPFGGQTESLDISDDELPF